MTSKDVVYTYAAFLDPDYISPFKGAFRVLESVRALDDYTVEFRLKEPFAAFPAQLAGVPPIVPAGSGDAMRTFPIGTGPYRFVSAGGRRGDALGLRGLLRRAAEQRRHRAEGRARRHDAGARAAQGHGGRRRQRSAARHGAPARDAATTSRCSAIPGSTSRTSACNMRDPVLKDKRVRHAIGYAIDRDAIVQYLRRGLARPAIGLVPPQAWAFEPDVHTFTFDPARAKALLDEAGYRDPDGDGPRPRLRLSLKISTNEETRLQSTVIQQDLRRVGIDLDVRSYEFATLLRRRAQGQLPDLLAAVGRRRAGRSRHPAARLSLAAGAAGRIQSRLLQQSRGGSADRRGVARAHRRGAARQLRPGAADHRRGRAVHSDLEPGQRDPGAARATPGCTCRRRATSRRSRTCAGHRPVRCPPTRRRRRRRLRRRRAERLEPGARFLHVRRVGVLVDDLREGLLALRRCCPWSRRPAPARSGSRRPAARTRPASTIVFHVAMAASS